MSYPVQGADLVAGHILPYIATYMLPLDIPVRWNHLFEELETVSPGIRKPIFLQRNRPPEDDNLQEADADW